MRQNLFAHTEPGSGYPGFVSINREANGDISVHVRSAPTMVEGIRICGVHCRPGGPGCNNYCGHDRSKPMPDLPEAMTHIVPGSEASIVVPAREWERFRLPAAGSRPADGSDGDDGS